MQIFSSPNQYGAVAKVLHWSTVLFVVLAWSSGELHDEFPRGEPRAMALFAHASLGLLIVGTLVLRLMWRTVDRPPTHLSTPLGGWADRAGYCMHGVLLILLAAIPISGIILQFSRGAALPLFGVYEMASPWAADRSFARSVKSVHELLANAILILAGLHAFAALTHSWIFQDRTLARMLPGRTQ